MIYELWNVKFDSMKLQQHLKEFVLPLEAVFQIPAFGGWSVLSSNGSYKDGWHTGHRLYSSSQDTQAVLSDLSKKNIKRASEYIVPTEICHGYLEEVLDVIKSHKLMPHRARIIQLTAGLSSSWHRDGADHDYSVRLHIPIQTNPFCFFETESEQAHLAADGSAYFIYVNRIHRVINSGPDNRYHLVIDVRDMAGVTQFHRYSDFQNKKASDI